MLDTNICIYIIKNKPLNVRKKLESYSFGEIAISSLPYRNFITEFIKVLNRSKIYQV